MDISVDQLIENSFVISIDSKILCRFNSIFSNAGFTALPKPFSGFKFNRNQFTADKFTKKLYENKNSTAATYGALGCGVSHAALVKHADLIGLDFVCIFEDDAYPCIDVIQKMQTALQGIPDDCDILKLGWSRIYNKKEDLSQKFNREPQSYGTFAYIVFKKYYKEYFRNFEKSYISDHIVMNNDNVHLYHVQQKLFSYYNSASDKPLHSYGNPKIDGKDFSLSYMNRRLIQQNTIQPKQELIDALHSIQPFAYRANGGNAGDIIIALAETQLFDDQKLDYTMVNASNKQQMINQPFNLVYGGGGGWIDLYSSNCAKQLNTYFKNKNLRKAIVLPSTFYKCDDIVKSFDERFTVFCRDIQSLNYCKSMNQKANFILHNDMAFSADFSCFQFDNLDDVDVEDAQAIKQKMHEYRMKNKSSTASFIRTDREKTVSTDICKIDNFDLSLIKGVYGENLSLSKIRQYSKLFLYMIDKYQTICTNRLHVAICSYKLNKHIVCYNNSYGKVFNVLKYSIPEYEKIEFK